MPELARIHTFCSAGCREGFRADRKHGLIYGPSIMPDGSDAPDWETGSRAWGVCPYDGRTTSTTRLHEANLVSAPRLEAEVRAFLVTHLF